MDGEGRQDFVPHVDGACDDPIEQLEAPVGQPRISPRRVHRDDWDAKLQMAVVHDSLDPHERRHRDWHRVGELLRSRGHVRVGLEQLKDLATRDATPR